MRVRLLTALPTTVVFLLSLVCFAAPALAGPPHGVEVCHVPPGNPANAHTITVNPNALPAHLGHGDVLGPCSEITSPTTTLRDYLGALHPRELHPKRRKQLIDFLDAVDEHLATPDACAASDELLLVLDVIDEWYAKTQLSIFLLRHHWRWVPWHVRRNQIALLEDRLDVLDEIREHVLRLRVAVLAETPAGVGCAGGGTVAVDPTIVPVMESIPNFEEGGPPRPLAALRNARGVQTDFVANELWLVSDDQAEADAVAARLGAPILLTVEGGDGSVHSLLRVDAPVGDPAALPALLADLKPDVTDALSISSVQARDLLAMAAEEAASGLRMGFNVVGIPQDIRDGNVLEAALGPNGWNSTGGWSRNPFDWFHMSGSETQAIGVPEAWQLLANLDLLDPLSVGLGVVDGGFLANDLHPASIYRSTLPGFDGLGGENPFSAWHGVKVMQTAAGLVDNLEGAAGVAGPVARPINVYAGGDFFAGAMIGTRTALENGAQIVNVSSTADVPSIVDWLTLPFRAYTGELRGAVFVASAGNNGPDGDSDADFDKGDVDAEQCILGICWESTFHTPCENPGVICVGGLNKNSLGRDQASSYGTEHSASVLGNESVDIYAPFCVLIDGIDTPGTAQSVCGTSYSSPYVAGVAALMLAADPTLTKDQVAVILRNTARTDSPDPVIHRIVDAEAAVRLALLPGLNIVEPADPSTVPGAVEVRFEAFRFPESITDEITWTSDRDGVLGTGLVLVTDTLSTGAHVVTASDGFLSDSVVVLVTTIGIIEPSDGDQIIVTETDSEGVRFANVQLVGAAFDAEDGALTGSSLVWTDSINGGAEEMIGTGSPTTVRLDLVGGARTSHRIKLTATDSDGNAESFTITVEVDEFI